MFGSASLYCTYTRQWLRHSLYRHHGRRTAATTSQRTLMDPLPGMWLAEDDQHRGLLRNRKDQLIPVRVVGPGATVLAWLPALPRIGERMYVAGQCGWTVTAVEYETFQSGPPDQHIGGVTVRLGEETEEDTDGAGDGF